MMLDDCNKKFVYRTTRVTKKWISIKKNEHCTRFLKSSLPHQYTNNRNYKNPSENCDFAQVTTNTVTFFGFKSERISRNKNLTQWQHTRECKMYSFHGICYGSKKLGSNVIYYNEQKIWTRIKLTIASHRCC